MARGRLASPPGDLTLTGFKLIDLHLHWAALKEHGRVAAQNIPLPVQSALTTLGLAILDRVTQDLIITDPPQLTGL